MVRYLLLVCLLTLTGCGGGHDALTKTPTWENQMEAGVGFANSEFTNTTTPLSPYQACLVENDGDPSRYRICAAYNDWQRYKLTAEDLCRPHDLICVYNARTRSTR